jgi:hypothetical protein
MISDSDHEQVNAGLDSSFVAWLAYFVVRRRRHSEERTPLFAVALRGHAQISKVEETTVKTVEFNKQTLPNVQVLFIISPNRLSPYQ